MKDLSPHMALLAVPLNVYDHLLQYVSVSMMAPMRALQSGAARLFEKRFFPEIFVALTRSMRLGGRLLLGPCGETLERTPLTSATLLVTMDAPIDWAGQPGSLLRRLLLQLPGPRKVWKDGRIVGLGFKKPRGTCQEMQAALLACATQELGVLSLTDARFPKHLPPWVYECSIEVLHYAGPPTADLLAKLELFKSAPKCLCFHRSALCFLTWAAQHPEKSRGVKCLGDLILTPEGLQGWCARNPPARHVTKIGLAITTGRYGERSVSWQAEAVAESIMNKFPNLRVVAVNLEVSYECQVGHQAAVLALLRHMVRAGVRVVTYDVLLIQLPSSARKRDGQLHSLDHELRQTGVAMIRKPKARSTKNIPCDGFDVPAVLSLCAPPAVSQDLSLAEYTFYARARSHTDISINVARTNKKLRPSDLVGVVAGGVVKHYLF